MHTNIKKIDAMAVVTQGREKHEMAGTEWDNDKPVATMYNNQNKTSDDCLSRLYDVKNVEH